LDERNGYVSEAIVIYIHVEIQQTGAFHNGVGNS
jgi:hypothetical protein